MVPASLHPASLLCHHCYDSVLANPNPARRLFPQPWPREVVLAWSVAGSLFAVLFGVWCWRYYVLGRRGPAVRRSQRLKSQ